MVVIGLRKIIEDRDETRGMKWSGFVRNELRVKKKKKDYICIMLIYQEKLIKYRFRVGRGESANVSLIFSVPVHPASCLINHSIPTTILNVSFD
jgi:hypothetical protein